MNELEMLEWSNPVPELRGNPGPAPVPVDAEAPVPLSSRRGRRAPRRLFAAAAAVVAIAGGAVAITTLGDDGGSTELDATAVTPPGELGELVAGGPWRVLADDPEVFGTADVALPPEFDPMSTITFPGQTLVSDVIADGDGLLAVGQFGAPNQSITAVWESEDGRTWERIDDEVFGTIADDLDEGVAVWANISSVATFDGVVVAAGSAMTDRFSMGTGDPPGVDDAEVPTWDMTEALWRRGADGVWQRLDAGLPIDDADRGAGVGIRLDEIVATESGFVLAGALGTDPQVSAEVRPRLWHSPDGSTWTQVATGVLPDGAAVNGLSSSDGMTVAVGSTDGAAVFAGDMVAWYSTDGGLTWSAAETDRGDTDLSHSVMADVVATPEGFLAVGSHNSGGDVSVSSTSGGDGQQLSGDVDVAVWTSEDGRRWEAAPSPAINDLERHDRAFAVEALPDGRIVVAANTDRPDGSGATTLVGPPDRLELVADTQPFVFQSLAPGPVPGQVIAGTSPSFAPFAYWDDSDDPLAEIRARVLEGIPGSLFVLDAIDLPVPAPAAGQAEPDADVTPGEAAGSDDEVSPDDCVASIPDVDRSPSERELVQLRNRAVRELNAAGFDVVEGSIGEFVEVCDSVLLDLADEVTLRVYGNVEAARQAVAESFPGEPIVVVASALSSEEVSTAVPRVIDALDDATEQGLVPDGVQIVSIGGDVFGPADVLVELATADVELLSDAEWADLQPAANALAAELSAATGLDVAVDRAITLPADD